MRTRLIAYAALVMAATAPRALAGIPLDPDGLVSVETSVGTDTVTVGQRFTVDYVFTYPDSLRMLPERAIELEKSRVLSAHWSESTRDGSTTRSARVTAITLDLEGASVPELPFEFVTAGGETIRAFTRAVTVPVRLMAADTAAMAPLKEQWEAPRSLLAWGIAAVAAALLAALVWWLVRWRRRRPVAEVLVPALPADYVAMNELARIERIGLLERGEFKEYYTLVVDAVRRYLEARFAPFGIEAMDRTTEELLEDMRRAPEPVPALEPLLREADLVKFAKYRPTVSDGRAAMHGARAVVTATTPRTNPALVNAGDEVHEQAG